MQHVTYFPISIFTGQQQHFRPFFDTRFTGHLLELRRKSDPFSMAGGNTQGKKKVEYTSILHISVSSILIKSRIPYIRSVKNGC